MAHNQTSIEVRTQPVTLEARLLGGLSLRYNGHSVPESAFRRRHGLILLLWLLVDPTHRLSTEVVLEQFWPDQDPQAGAVNLRAVLSSMRAAFGGSASPLVARADATLILHPELALDLDVAAFEQAAGVALAGSDPAALRAALSWYRGPLLPMIGYEEWVLSRRDELDRLHTRMLGALASLEAPIDPVAAEDRFRALLTADPANEEAAQALMRLLAAHGKRAEAMRVYQGLAAALRRELEVLPAPETEALRAALLTEAPPLAVGPRAIPEATTPSAPGPMPLPPGNLPARLSSFVGRAWEQAEIVRLLDEARLLTLTGTGGSGKTRLALEVAAQVAVRYPGGIWLVELAGLTDPGLVTEALAGPLGLQEAPRRSLLSSVIDRLAPSPVLLVLDNCEHLLGACADLAASLLRACPQLHILATSRERLNIAGEIVWHVPSLSLIRPAVGTGPAAIPSPAQVAQSEAAQLFLERARAVRPGFALTKENAPWISKICLRLDGIPLAIELAAARLASISVEQLAARLDACFKLLTGGDRAALPRHHTLQATLDWSFRLLTAQEQAVLCRLSVFAGGWPLDAAEAVLSASTHTPPPDPAVDVPSSSDSGLEIAAEDVLDLLSRLVAKSLVSVTEQDSQMRYGLLEVVRQYAREHLERRGEAARWRDLHFDWCLDLAERAETALTSGQQEVWLKHLEAEHDNLRAALSWSLAQRTPTEPPETTPRGLRLAGTLGRFWLMRGYLSEGRRWLTEALARYPEAPTAARCAVLDAAGHLASSQGDYPQAVALHEESLALRRKAGDARGLATALIGLGNIAREQADYPRAVAFYEESLDLLRRHDDWEQMGSALNGLANVANEQGGYSRAIALYEESLVLARRIGDTAGMARRLNNLGNVAQQQGDYPKAASFYEQSLALKRELGDRRGIAVSLGNLGNVAHLRGDSAQAAILYQDALALSHELGDKRSAANILTNLAGLACDTGEYALAARQYGEALGLHLALGDRRGITWDVGGLAIVAGSQFAAGLPDQPRLDPALLTRLFGAVDTLHEVIGAPAPQGERRAYQQALHTLRTALSAGDFDAAWTAGKALGMEDAIPEALELAGLLHEPDPPMPRAGTSPPDLEY